jgi:hypothetical protein
MSTIAPHDGMDQVLPRKSHLDEYTDLQKYYELILAWDGIQVLREALSDLASGPAIFIATGGSLAVARAAAQLHEQSTGFVAKVCTPLEFATLSPMRPVGKMLFSASVKHPDALATLKSLGGRYDASSVLVTMRDRADISDAIPANVRCVSLPALDFKEGFLATTSIVMMIASLIRAHLSDGSLPSNLPSLDVEFPGEGDRYLVLTTPSLFAVSTDIETRLTELGVASVQVADYRNFAHGRHVGFARRSAQTRVIALMDGPLSRLAESTVRELTKEGHDVAAWRSTNAFPICILDLLPGSIALVGQLSALMGINPARPGVPEFGRHLYHLPIKRLLPQVSNGPVDRKLLASPASESRGIDRKGYESAFLQWRDRIAEVAFAGVVLDYDGTVCETEARFELPVETVQRAIVRLLGQGFRIGFASGRGKSLHRDLREWVPEHHWKSIDLALYNGGIELSLQDELPKDGPSHPDIRAAADRLTGALSSDVALEERSTQITITSPGVSGNGLLQREPIRELLEQRPVLPIRILVSGHSVDVIPSSSSKRNLLGRLEAETGQSCLAIGDQGNVGGNDFELLSSTPWSLSVDLCSDDPTRCWHPDVAGKNGPQAGSNPTDLWLTGRPYR